MGNIMNYLIRLITIVGVLLSAEISENVRIFNEHGVYRWAQIFAIQCAGKVRTGFEDDTGLNEPHQLVELVDFPQIGNTYCSHFQGSPLEASTDSDVIQHRLDILISRYGPTNIRFATLEGWTSDAFLRSLEQLHFSHMERKPIMMLRGLESLNADLIRDLGSEFEARRLTQKDDLWKQYVNLRPAPIRWMMSEMEEDAITHHASRYWCIVNLATHRCITTAQISVQDGSGYLGQVSTAMEYRSLGLATSLTIAAINDAYHRYPNLKNMFLDSSPMAISMYTKLGFEIIGWINVYTRAN